MWRTLHNDEMSNDLIMSHTPYKSSVNAIEQSEVDCCLSGCHLPHGNGGIKFAISLHVRQSDLRNRLTIFAQGQICSSLGMVLDSSLTFDQHVRDTEL